MGNFEEVLYNELERAHGAQTKNSPGETPGGTVPDNVRLYTRLTRQSLCLHEALATAAITSETCKACFARFIFAQITCCKEHPACSDIRIYPLQPAR